jgi:hypothetical protein
MRVRGWVDALVGINRQIHDALHGDIVVHEEFRRVPGYADTDFQDTGVREQVRQQRSEPMAGLRGPLDRVSHERGPMRGKGPMDDLEEVDTMVRGELK